MSFSVLTKIFLGFLGPIFCIGLLIGEFIYVGKKFKLSILLPSLTWGLTFSAILIFSGIFLVGLENLNQLFDTHFTATELGFLSNEPWNSINYHLKDVLAFVVLGLIGTLNLIK